MRSVPLVIFWIFVEVCATASAATSDSWTQSAAEKPDPLPTSGYQPRSQYSLSLNVGLANDNEQPSALGLTWNSSWLDRRALVANASFWTSNHLRIDIGERIQFLEKNWYGKYWVYSIGPKLRAGNLTADLIDYEKWEAGLGLGWNPIYDRYPLYTEVKANYSLSGWLALWKLSWIF